LVKVNSPDLTFSPWFSKIAPVYLTLFQSFDRVISLLTRGLLFLLLSFSRSLLLSLLLQIFFSFVSSVQRRDKEHGERGRLGGWERVQGRLCGAARERLGSSLERRWRLDSIEVEHGLAWAD
jgi:hypothetical protein